MLLSPERHVYQKLASTPGVARFVGFRIFPIAVPKAGTTMPLIAYRRVNILREPTLSGPLFRPMVSLQISCWALSYDAVRELADEVRLALDGNIGTLAGVTISDMRLTSEADDYIDPTEVGAQLPPAYEVRQLYSIRWHEATE